MTPIVNTHKKPQEWNSRSPKRERESSTLFFRGWRSCLTGVILWLGMVTPLLAGDSTAVYWENLWATRQAQIELMFAQYPVHDSILDSLYAQAQQAYARQDYQVAYELLMMVWELAVVDTSTVAEFEGSSVFWDSTATVSAQNSPFQIEVGIDESAYQTRSVLLPETSSEIYAYRSPYTAIQWNYTAGSGEQSFALNHRIRVDNQYFNYFLRNYWQRQVKRYFFRLDVNGDYYHDFRDSTNKYVNLDVAAIVGNRYAFPFQWYLRGFFRMKRYLNAQAVYPQLNQKGVEVNGEWAVGWFHRIGGALGWDDYGEFNPRWNWYQTASGRVFYRYARTVQRYWESSVYVEQRRFATFLDTTQYANQYVETTVQVRGEIPLWGSLSNYWKVYGQWRNAQTADAFTPNEQSITLEVQPRWYWGLTNYMGMGVYFERSNYRADGQADGYVRTFDRTIQGVTLSINYLDTRNRSVVLEVRWGNATYPQGEKNPFPTLYSDTRTFSINGMVWWPITRHIQLQGFMNYNTERSLTYENTASSGTTFSFGIVYRW